MPALSRGETRGSQVPGPSCSCVPWSSTPPGATAPRPLSVRSLLPSGSLTPWAPGSQIHFVAAQPTAHMLAYLRIAESVTLPGARLATGRAGSPLAGRVSHPLDDEQGFMKSSHTPILLDQPCLVALKTEITGYLARRPDRFFSSIVVAAMEGEPSWHPVEMDTNIVPKIFAISSSMRDSFGVLSFGDEPKYYALDGQHRVAAIKLLIDRQAGIDSPPGFDDDFLSVIMVLREEHNIPEEEWMRRYRRLSSSLNRHAKPTDRDTNIIMDEDDLFAIVTRRLITDHEFFQAPDLKRQSFKVITKGKNLKAGTSHFTTLQTLYAINTTLLTTALRRMSGWHHDERCAGDLNTQVRPDEEYIDAYYEELSNYWNAILEVLPDLRRQPSEMRNHDISDGDSGQYRDHLLFWPIGQELLAKVARSLLDIGQIGDDADVSSLKTGLRPLAEVPWDLHHAPWRYLLLVPKTPDEESWRMRNEDRTEALEHAYHLLRWVVGLDTLNEGEKEELRAKWENLLLRPPSETDVVDAMWQEIEDTRARIATRGERSGARPGGADRPAPQGARAPILLPRDDRGGIGANPEIQAGALR